VDGPTTLHGEYDDDGGFRIAGWIIIGVSSLVAAAGFADAARRPRSPGNGIGLLTLLGGVPLGLAFALNWDNATLTKSEPP
jgi:hypothetical protein